MTASTTLVLGGTGKTGRRIVEQLTARRVPVRVGSRTATPSFVWEDSSTWPAALAGVGAVYISYYPDLAAPGATDAIRAFTELAVRSGARRLVLLSGRGELEAQRCEEIVKASGAQWTVLRCSWFNQNFSENYLLEPILAGCRRYRRRGCRRTDRRQAHRAAVRIDRTATPHVRASDRGDCEGDWPRDPLRAGVNE